MAASAWAVYNLAKKKIGNGTISLAATVFRMSLFTSASNFATATLGVISSVTNEVSEANGYSSSGKALTGEIWTVGASAGQYKFDTDDAFWSANGGAISNIKGAVIWLSGASAGGRHLLCRSTLSSSQFAISAGNRLTVQMNVAGVLLLA
ncbi:MAG: hypothetical protein AB7R67_20295 [Vicinamibacterales bacterium]